VSVVEVSFIRVGTISPARSESSRTCSARSRLLIRLPLWASAIEPVAVARNVGWAFCHTLAPVVE
jgi:hypothetical protein